MAMNRNAILVLGLILSVTLNLFLLGVMGARIVNRDAGAPPPLSLGWMLRGTDPELRPQLMPLLEESDSVLRPLRGQMFRAQREVNRLLVESPMDSAALEEAFDALRAANMRYQEASHSQITTVFGHLDVEQRHNIMQFMESRRNPMDGPGRSRTRENGVVAP